MSNNDPAEDTIAATPLDALNTSEGDFLKTVFLFPLSAPLPNELEEFAPEEGSLLKRIAPLADVEPLGDIALVSISGGELVALDRAWQLIKVARKVSVLTELPGARYDVMFTQAVRQLGLRSMPWPAIEAAFSERQTTRQRTKDVQPWVTDEIEMNKDDANPTQLERRTARGSNLADADRRFDPPAQDDDDEDLE